MTTTGVSNRRMRAAAALLCTLALAVLAAGCDGDDSGTTSTQTVTEPTPAASTQPSPPPPAAPSGDDLFGRIPSIVNRVSPSVVAVLTTTDGGSGTGSGVIWSADGIIVTNHHVIEGARTIQVAFASGRRVTARVEADDEQTDLALLRVDEEGLPTATFSDELPAVGALAIAIGAPLGFENTVTAGIVSGLHRNIPVGDSGGSRALVDLIQTDTAISPGNSGGALVDAEGKVIGINVAYAPPESGAVAIGFAIPSPSVIDIVEQLLEDGEAEHAYLGIVPAPITPDLVEQFDLEAEEGVIVYRVEPGSPAARADLEPGDVITAVADDPVRTVEDLFAALRARSPGDEVVLTVVRDGSTQEIDATLGALPTAQ